MKTKKAKKKNKKKWFKLAKKRGRPKEKPLEELLPNLNDEDEIRMFLKREALILNVLMVERAKKKNNIKNPTIARAKTYELKQALEGLKITASIIKNEDLKELKNKFDSFEFGLIENDDEARFEFEKLNEEFEKMQQD